MIQKQVCLYPRRTWMGRVRHTLQSRLASGPQACDCRSPSSTSCAFCGQAF